MSARIPDWLDPRTLRWLALREDDHFDDLYKISRARAERIFRGEEVADANIGDQHVIRCDTLANSSHSKARWMRAAATRIENRLAKRGVNIRGFGELRVLAALAISMLVVVLSCELVGHALSDRDRARAADAACEKTLCTCLDGWRHTIDRCEDLDEAIHEHIARDEDDACVCWHPEAL